MEQPFFETMTKTGKIGLKILRFTPVFCQTIQPHRPGQMMHKIGEGGFGKVFVPHPPCGEMGVCPKVLNGSVQDET